MNSLENLYVSNSKLQGKVPSFFGSMCRLQRLDLSNNRLHGKFPNFVQNSSWCSRHILRIGPNFPSWIQTQNSLIQLDISDNGLNDFVPEWFWNKLQVLCTLNMSHNNLMGTIPNIQLKLRLRPSINLNSNKFEGKVPLYFLQASELLLSTNKFSDFVCVNVTNTSLATLDLLNNQIKGQLPDCWKSVNGLLFLDLSSNQLSGKIPISMGTLVQLEALVLRNNNLTGELPSSLKNCNNLIMLDVSENMLSSSIPSWVGENIQQLIILIMRGNQFSGDIPLHLCYLKRIQLLDLSRNKMSQGIPTCLNNFTALSQKGIDKGETESRVHCFTRLELILQTIDLSSNNLTGEMPKEITHMLGLCSLNLSRNNLNGEIPSEIGNLSLLDSLDLSRNHFSRKISSTLSNIDRLAMLDLSKNHLSGRIPLGRQLQTFDSSSFEGNLDLCGKPLEKSCPGDETTIKSEGPEGRDEDDNSIFYGAFYMILGLGFFIGFLGLLGPLLLWQSWRVAYLMLLNRLIDYILDGNISKTP
ncbi:probable LRR receptor-like serine/threonine-protein kinase At1g34110 [Vigna radiata var. radiata]|uniref:Probable LRR receptor-like serine/threonine-protein kinase At1g34110 n=1 Tax=Vigna radiata var. radiata TaxID=3916 RepID=A0A1S3TZB0_VIGRR|nr:probable LRR receptor-like serine/threonine-protein kinase At1g34110 [Vigna radiata var. radiata]